MAKRYFLRHNRIAGYTVVIDSAVGSMNLVYLDARIEPVVFENEPKRARLFELWFESMEAVGDGQFFRCGRRMCEAAEKFRRRIP